MNHYYTSSGERVAKSVIDRRTTEAKRQKIEDMTEEYGYIFCEECGRNATTGIPLDCSHTISVNDAQKTGRTELAWTVSNIKIRCRICHQKHDNTYLETSKIQNDENSRQRVYAGRNKLPVTRKFRIA